MFAHKVENNDYFFGLTHAENFKIISVEGGKFDTKNGGGEEINNTGNFNKNYSFFRKRF